MTTNISKTLLLLALVVAGVIGGIALLRVSSNVSPAEAETATTEARAITNTEAQVGDISEKSSAPKTAESKDDDDDERPVGQPTLTEAQAIVIAKGAYKGDGRMTEIELEMEHGVLVYGVEFTESDGNEVDVKLDAKTGAIVTIESDETDSDDEDDDED